MLPGRMIRSGQMFWQSCHLHLNRVYTEWYRNKGYDFTITSSTAYDHKWIYGRNIFDSISSIVDELFENYLSRPDVRQPILTQYCDGRQVSVQKPRVDDTVGQSSRWESRDILRLRFCGIIMEMSIYINVAEAVSRDSVFLAGI